MTATPPLPSNVQYVYNTTDWGFILSNINNTDAGNYSLSVRAYDLIGGSTYYSSVDFTLNITENQGPTTSSASDVTKYAYENL